MSEYIVKTYSNRNLVIEADGYHACNDNHYEFYTESENKRTTVAIVPHSPNIFSIIKNEAEKSDHYYVYDWNEEDRKEAEFPAPEPSDVCLGCQYSDLLGSEAFYDAVWEIVDSWHGPDEDAEELAETIQ
jgi:hypothetical protein